MWERRCGPQHDAKPAASLLSRPVTGRARECRASRNRSWNRRRWTTTAIARSLERTCTMAYRYAPTQRAHIGRSGRLRRSRGRVWRSRSACAADLDWRGPRIQPPFTLRYPRTSPQPRRPDSDDYRAPRLASSWAVVHDAVVGAAGPGAAGAGPVAAQHLRGGPAVQLH